MQRPVGFEGWAVHLHPPGSWSCTGTHGPGCSRHHNCSDRKTCSSITRAHLTPLACLQVRRPAPPPPLTEGCRLALCLFVALIIPSLLAAELKLHGLSVGIVPGAGIPQPIVRCAVPNLLLMLMFFPYSLPLHPAAVLCCQEQTWTPRLLLQLYA